MEYLTAFLNWCIGNFLPCLIVFYVFLILLSFFTWKALIKSFREEKSELSKIIKG